MKPLEHALTDVKKFGGVVDDYIKIHEFFDQTKAFEPSMTHRAVLHNAFGIYLCTQVFGDYFKNSDGELVAVRTIGERHVLQDLKFIPTFHDCFGDMPLKDWMMGQHRPIRAIVFTEIGKEVNS